MAILDKTSFKALYGSSGTTFPNNTTELIEEGDLRQFGEDQADSFMSLADNFIDEDSFATDSATKAPSQQSTKAYITAQIAATLTGLAWKSSVLCATTANITLSGLQTIDGIFAGGGSRVLVKNQSTASQNGIYVTGAGAWVRATDNDSTSEMQNAVVSVDQGTTNADTSWRQTTDSVTVGSSNVVWTSFGAGAGAASESSAGIAEIATQTEVNTGTDDSRFVTPLKLKTVLSTPEVLFFEADDFIGGIPLWSAVGTRSTSTFGCDATEKALGVYSFGGTTTGTHNLYKNNTLVLGCGNVLTLTARLAISNLSDGTDTYTLFWGLADTTSGTNEPGNGCYFRYTHSVNSGKYECVTRQSSVETATDSGVSAAAGIFSTFKIVVNDAGTSVEFYINDTLVQTNTTNIPLTSSEAVFPNYRQARTAGTASRVFYIDYYSFKIETSGGR